MSESTSATVRNLISTRSGTAGVRRQRTGFGGDLEPAGSTLVRRAGLEHMREQHRVGELAGECLALAHDRWALGTASQRPQAPLLVAKGAGTQRGIGGSATHGQRSVDPFQCVGVAISHQPIRTERDAQREGTLGVVAIDCPSEGRVKVRDVGFDVGEVLLTARAPQRAGGSVVLRELEQVAVWSGPGSSDTLGLAPLAVLLVDFDVGHSLELGG
jgi:hypothetical protein